MEIQKKKRGSYKKYLINREGSDGVTCSLPRTTEFIRRKSVTHDQTGLPYTSHDYVQDEIANQVCADQLTGQEHNNANAADHEAIECSIDVEFKDFQWSERCTEQEPDSLFPGCPLNKMEAVILIFAYAMRQKLPNTGINDLLSLINILLPKGYKVPETVYQLEKLLGADYSSAKRHYYCHQCDILLADGKKLCSTCLARSCRLCKNSLTHDIVFCEVCGAQNRKVNGGKFFVTFDITNSLAHVLSRTAVKDSILNNFKKRVETRETITDIIDGRSYQRLNLTGHDLSCCINTDGASIFNSRSSFSLWPLLFSLNELDYPLRRKHTILGGLWWGVGKPNFDLFLEPVVLQLQELQTRRLRWNCFPDPVPSRVLFPLFATDAVAKCQFQGMTQFNGEFGCPWCLIPGEGLRDDLNNFVKWIYDPTLECERRTNSSYRMHVRGLCESLCNGRMEKESVFGVKNASQLLLFPGLDIIDGNTFDVMHSGLLGVLKTFTLAFFDSSNHGQQFYLGPLRNQINKRITQCKFPAECGRVLRPLEELKQWKASEWKLWMLLSTSILDGLLPVPYLRHLSFLTNFLSTLLQNEITHDDLRTSTELVNNFCNLIPTLYSTQFFLFNVHILRHATDCVRDWGPLWGYSLFQFENFNNVLVNSYSGTRKVGEQIVHRTIRSQEVYSQSESIFENECAKALCDSFISRKKMYVKSKSVKDCTFLGSCKQYQLSELEKRLMCSVSIPSDAAAHCYKSCIIKKKIFKARCHSAAGSSDYILLSDNKFYEIETILSIDQFEFGILFVRRLCLAPDNYGLNKFRFKINSSVLSALGVLTPQKVQNCKVACFSSEDGRLKYICPLVNSIELE